MGVIGKGFMEGAGCKQNLMWELEFDQMDDSGQDILDESNVLTQCGGETEHGSLEHLFPKK
jgi:hypothetical protein